ncbi:hypothetical protein [Salinibacter ruber]|uniref:hypothetical protein n=1 Tax=Salinibacter ruber TaxID=146919 RepID=UPI000E57C65F|nr:hypothetical protein [Salinibacter ruber]
MNHLDLLQDLADDDGEVDPTEARAIINNAEEELESLKGQVSERFPEDEDAPETAATSQKSRSEISRSERAEMYQEWRERGLDPNEEWQKLPR